MREVIIVLAAFVALGANVPYILDVLKGRSKPNIASWSTWLGISIIAATSAYASGAYGTAILSLADAPGALLILWLGLRKGTRKYTRFDAFCQALAVSGLALWQVFGDPVLALSCAVIANFFAILPTLRHTYQYPWEETWITYFIYAIAALAIALSAEHYNFRNLILPLEIVLMNNVLVGIILVRRRVAAVTR